ncbi:MAG: DUF1841 family protein [Candidatus Competibacteraceae bacterium]|nr:DUF1841 family protein [Candidatus Competibacteraceae bacterium]
MFGNDRDSIRRYYCTVWSKASAAQPLEPLERLIAEVIGAHPEYQALLGDADAILNRDYWPEMGETNPFLHMGMHIALREQLGSNRPDGIRAIHRQLCRRVGEAHAAEHLMIECLGATLWEAQKAGRQPDERAFLERLQQLLR